MAVQGSSFRKTEETGTGSSRADRVYGNLRSLITGSEVRPGHHLSENRLASRLGVSRTPIREALQRLLREGLVERSPTGGLIVAGLTPRIVNETCDLLEVLDVYMFRRAAARSQDEQTVELNDLARLMCEAAKEGDVDVWANADSHFHRLIEEAAGNAQAADLSHQLRNRLHRFWVGSASRQRRLEACSREHKDIAAAVGTQDLQTVDTLVREHVSHMRVSLLQMLSDASSLVGDASGDVL